MDAAVRAPFTARSLRDLVFCLAGVLAAVSVLAVPFLLSGIAFLTDRAVGRSGDRPAVSVGFLVAMPVVLVLVVVFASPVGRAAGRWHRATAARLLGAHIAEPPPRRPGRSVAKLVGDGVGWRGIAYSLLKVPLAVVEGYGAFCFVFGLVNLTYPLWWHLFRNHPAGVRLSPARVLTPLGAFGVGTFPGTFAAAAAGAAMVLVAPWVMRGGCAMDLAVMRWLLGPGRLAERLAQLQAGRTRAVDDAAAMVRRLERDLHDGAQIHLATLAMNLGMASEKLGTDGPPPDLAQARDLVAIAHRGAKDALAELRDLVRGIHPPVLDNGLPDALATLASGAALPVTVTTDLPVRPAPAIETIAYFCAAELLANAAKHSGAGHVGIDVAQRGERLVMTVSDDGTGGADPVGAGLSGLADRASVVDGRIRIASPAGGPTRITVELPMRT